jgi:hypothetical protein
VLEKSPAGLTQSAPASVDGGVPAVAAACRTIGALLVPGGGGVPSPQPDIPRPRLKTTDHLPIDAITAGQEQGAYRAAGGALWREPWKRHLQSDLARGARPAFSSGIAVEARTIQARRKAQL